jgi:nucleoside-diphosphate-sugar epimerase
MTPHLLCFGFGFSAKAFAPQLAAQGFRVSATSRGAEGREEITAAGFEAQPFPIDSALLENVTHILVSAPPGEAGDPVLLSHADDLCRHASHIGWLGYLSTTGVYGDAGGAWVEETSPLAPNTERGRRRLKAENDWLSLHARCGLPVHLFRLAGIYGPGRNQLQSVLDGTARRIIKEGQVFSRIHVDDIAGVLLASIARPHPTRAYNVCDDYPCPPQEVVAFAAELLGLPLPPEIPFEKAQLSPMARSFYADSKRVSNARIKRELGYELIYKDYRAGLTQLARQARLLPA